MGIFDNLLLRSDAAGKSTNRTYHGQVNSYLLTTIYNAVTQFTNAVRAQERAVTTVKDDGDKINMILKYLRKLAVDSAVDDSLKGVAGGVLMDKIVKDGPKDQTLLNTSTNQKNKLGLEVAEVVRAGIEQMQEHENCIEPQMTVSTQTIRLLDCFEDLPKEPIKVSNSPKTSPRRIMIRSRL